MSHKGILASIAIVLALAGTSVASNQVGLSGLRSFTNHERFPSPAGFGLFVQKSLSRTVALRFSYQKGHDSDAYVRTIALGEYWIHPADTIHDLWKQSSSMTAYDLSILINPLGRGRVNLFIGAGIGLANLYLSIVGDNSQYEISDHSHRHVAYSLLLSIECEPYANSPVVAHTMIR